MQSLGNQECEEAYIESFRDPYRRTQNIALEISRLASKL
jgi:hypothetical protein